MVVGPNKESRAFCLSVAEATFEPVSACKGTIGGKEVESYFSRSTLWSDGGGPWNKVSIILGDELT